MSDGNSGTLTAICQKKADEKAVSDEPEGFGSLYCRNQMLTGCGDSLVRRTWESRQDHLLLGKRSVTPKVSLKRGEEGGEERRKNEKAFCSAEAEKFNSTRGGTS